MRAGLTACIAACVIFAGSLTGAVNVGDELFSKDTAGTFYVFADSVSHACSGTSKNHFNA